MDCTRDEAASGEGSGLPQYDGLGELISVGFGGLYLLHWYAPQLFTMPWEAVCSVAGLQEGCCVSAQAIPTPRLDFRGRFSALACESRPAVWRWCWSDQSTRSLSWWASVRRSRSTRCSASISRSSGVRFKSPISHPFPHACTIFIMFWG